MKKAKSCVSCMPFVVLAGALAVLPGCYTSRNVAGDDLVGGPLNPYLWVTVPVDVVLSPIQIPRWIGDCDDHWKPLDIDAIRRDYHPTEFNYRNFVTRD